MPNSFQNAGATQEPSASAPLYTSKMFTGWYTNRSPLQDGVTPYIYDKLGYGRQDSILDGQNMEISPRLTLVRRAGATAWGANNPYNRINRFYSFNTFTLTTEVIRVMVDDSTSVWDAFDGSLKNLIFTKSPGASSTYFLGVGNTLYFTNGVDNMQATFNPATGVWSAAAKWGITAPVNAPIATQQPRSSPYPPWAGSMVYACWVPRADTSGTFLNYVAIRGSDGNLHRYGHIALPTDAPLNGQLGAQEPAWATSGQDGTITWTKLGTGAWQLGFGYGIGDLVVGKVSNPAGTPDQLFIAVHGGGANAVQEPNWGAASKVGMQMSDGSNGLIWQNIGRVMSWSDIATLKGGTGGVSNYITTQAIILDPNGYLQTIFQMGTSNTSPPSQFQYETYALTADGTQVIWQNTGPYSVPSSAAVVYGYEYMDSSVPDLSNMSPRSAPILVIQGNEVSLQGDGSTQANVDKVVIFRTAQGGSTLFYLDTIPNPGNVKWTYIDTKADSQLNTEWQAQIAGEGTPLPAGATCLAYHLGRVFAAVGNVVWASAGPDAIVGGSSGNAGFNISFTCQSKVIRLWPTSIGLVVFTVRDAYIILGNGVDVSVGGSGLYIQVWIENVPLLSYDAFTTFGTTAYLFTGKNNVISLDPGAGMVEVSQPIADVLETLNPKNAYLTYHSHNSRDTALYLGNGQDTWYRLNPNIAPESGFAWSLPAYPVMGMSALQSVEVTPGVYQLLIGPKVDGGRIFYRDTTTRADNGTAFPAYSDFGVITLASPGQLAGIGWMNLEALNVGNEPALMMLMGELAVSTTNPLEPVKRTRHDPTNLPESTTLDSTRYTFLRGGSPIWCRHLIFRADFGTNTTADELLSFTIYGALYQETAA